MQSIQRVAPLWVSSPLKPPVTEAIINLQALLVKSYLLNALSDWMPRRAGLASGIPLLGAT